MTSSKKTLQLDLENKKLLGVCAGLAAFLDVEIWVVRVVYLGAIFFGGWFLVPMYFLIWFLLDDSSQGMKDSLSNNHAVRHFRNLDYKKKLYKNTRNGKFLGVCAGLADYLEVSVLAVRIVFLALVFFTFFPIFLYFGAAIVLDRKPFGEFEPDTSSGRKGQSAGQSQASAEQAGADTGYRGDTGEKQKAWPSQSQQPDYSSYQEELFYKRREFRYCARKFVTLQNRLARLEAYVTSSHFRLHREFRSIS